MTKSIKRKPKNAKYRVPMVDNTLAIFQALADSGSGLTLKEVCSHACVRTTSAFRILFTLAESGYVVKDLVGGRYRLGSQMRNIVARASHVPDLVHTARPYMLQLHSLFGETVNLGVFRDGEIYYVDIIESRRAFRMTASVGSHIPIYCTALGKAIAAYLPKETLESVLNECPWTRLTPHTITNRKKFMKELEEAKRQGHYADNEESELGAYCLASPIIINSQNVSAGISLSGPCHRIRARQGKIIRELNRVCRQISKSVAESS